MRCKNCGFDNQEGRYICENCGSPLFDGTNEIVPEEDDDAPVRIDDEDDDEPAPAAADEDDVKNNKKNIIIIIVLAVILVTMLVGIIVAAVTGKEKETQTEPPVSVSEELTEDEEERETERRTTTTTTTAAPETTITTTTTTTTTAARFTISVDIDGNGTVSGDGTFEAGTRATLVATADEGYQFVGWFDNDTGTQAASGTRYTITVDSNRNLTARFSALPQQDEEAPTGEADE